MQYSRDYKQKYSNFTQNLKPKVEEFLFFKHLKKLSLFLAYYSKPVLYTCKT